MSNKKWSTKKKVLTALAIAGLGSAAIFQYQRHKQIRREMEEAEMRLNDTFEKNKMKFNEMAFGRESGRLPFQRFKGPLIVLGQSKPPDSSIGLSSEILNRPTINLNNKPELKMMEISGVPEGFVDDDD